LGSTPRAISRGGRFSLGDSQLAPSFGQLALELADLLRRQLGRRLALLGVASQSRGFLDEALTLRVLLGAPGLGLRAPGLRLLALGLGPLVLLGLLTASLGALATAYQLKPPAALRTGEHLESRRGQLRAESAVNQVLH